MEENQTVKKRPSPIQVETAFENVSRVSFIIAATGQTGTSVPTDKKIRLIHGRIYKLPVNADADSDKFTAIKVYSDLADKISVRFVKDHMAHVVPLQNNVVIESRKRLCVVW